MSAAAFVIRGAEVFPGDTARVRADVAVEDGRIAAVGQGLGGEEVVDGEGRWLGPGFIDMHAHAALRSFEEPLFAEAVAQGVTTQVINPDGLAPAPVAPGGQADRRAYLHGLEGDGPEEWRWATFAEYVDCLLYTSPSPRD